MAAMHVEISDARLRILWKVLSKALSNAIVPDATVRLLSGYYNYTQDWKMANEPTFSSA
jgi:hypothetical protein